MSQNTYVFFRPDLKRRIKVMGYPRRIIFHFARLKWMEIFSPGKFISEENIDQDPIVQFSKWYNFMKR